MKKISFLLFYVMLLTFSGCVTLHKPNAVYSPLLKEKGEINAGGAIGLSGTGLYNLQAAYAATDHIGFMMDGMYHYRQYTNADSGIQKLNIFSAEAGGGYFTTFGEEKKGLFQCYGGAGYGNANDKISNLPGPPAEVNAKYLNIFIQPGIAYTKPNFEIAGDVRVNYVSVYDVKTTRMYEFNWWDSNLNYYTDTALTFINLEPAVTMKAGGKNLKGVIQMGMTIPTYNKQSYFLVNPASMFGFPLFKFSVGLCYTFGRKD